MTDRTVASSQASAPGVYPPPGTTGGLMYWTGTYWDPRPIAPTLVRVLCTVVDMVLVGIIWFILIIPIALIFPSSGEAETSEGDAVGGTLGLVLAPLVAFLLYFVLFYRLTGRTLGMMMGRLYLVHIPTGSDRLTWGGAFARSLALGAGYLCGITVFVWLIITATSRTKQGPHDSLAKTAVLRDGRHVLTAPVVIATPSTTDAQASASEAPEPAVAPTLTAAAPATSPASQTPRPATDQATSRPDMFISHATAEADLARRLSDALEAQGVRTWIASRDVAVGGNYAAEIVRAISTSKHVLVLLSPASIESPHVRREVSIAIDRKVPILPVSTDPTGEFMAELPVDWTYWLSLAQVLRMSDEDATALEIAKRIGPGA